LESITKDLKENGAFAFRIPSDSKIIEADISGRVGNKNISGSIIDSLQNAMYDSMGTPLHQRPSGKAINVGKTTDDQDGETGNIYFGDVNGDTLVITGLDNGIENNLNMVFNQWYNSAPPTGFRNDFDLSGITSLYFDPYRYTAGLDWYSSMCAKIGDFVMNGGTVYLTGESYNIALSLSQQVDIGLKFHLTPPYTIYQGNGYKWVNPIATDLKEIVGQSKFSITFMPYDAG
jgi:hypothetical protein